MIEFDWMKQDASTGPIFGGESEDLDFTLLQWCEQQGVKEHVNTEVDVLMIVFTGRGEVIVDGELHEAIAGKIFLVPKNSRREIRSLSNDFRYLNIHKRRRRLMPGPMPAR